MIERILVPLDGSAMAEAVLAHAMRLLRRIDAEVLLVRAYGVGPMDVEAPALIDRVEGEVSAYLAGVERRLAARGLRVRAFARPGAAADVILSLAERERASLIALSTHGRSGLPRFVYGSVAEKVLRASQVPILAVHSFERVGEGATPPAELPLRHVLVAVNGSPTSLAVLPVVREVAFALDARVTLLHVIEDLRGLVAQAREDSPLAVAAGELARSKVPATLEYERGDAASGILDACRRLRPDLLALSTHGRSGVSRWVFGSVTEKVLRSADVPVLVVRARPEEAR